MIKKTSVVASKAFIMTMGIKQAVTGRQGDRETDQGDNLWTMDMTRDNMIRDKFGMDALRKRMQ